MTEPQEKKRCVYYLVIPGNPKRCWINPGMKCPDNVRCEPGIQLDAVVIVAD